MSDLESKFNSATDFLGVLSLGGVVLSGILLFTPAKVMGYIGIGSGLGAFTASVVTRKKHLTVATDELKTLVEHQKAEQHLHNELLLAKDGEIATLKADFSKGFKRIEQLSEQATLLQGQVDDLTVQNQSKEQIIEKVTEELDRLIALARTAVEESLDEWSTRINLLVATRIEHYPKMAERLDETHPGLGEKLSKHYPNLTKRLTELSDEANQLLDEYASRLERIPSKWDSLVDLLSLYYCLNDDLVNVKTKIIQAIAKLTNQETQLELQEVSEILEEWQTANLVPIDKLEHIIKNYEAALNEFRLDFSKRFDGVHQFATALEGQSQEDDKFVQGILVKMQELEQKIHHLSKPMRYLNATRTDMVIANIIIGYFERLGFILDRAGTDYRGYEATLEFITDRTGRLVLASELNEHVERLQPLTHVLNTLEFKLDPETGLMTLLVRWGNKPKSLKDDEIHRIIEPASACTKLIREAMNHRKGGKPTLRIMGATGEGKGIIARAILADWVKHESGEVWLSDPMDGSDEDRWEVPKAAKSSKEARQLLKAFVGEFGSRKNKVSSHKDVQILGLFDEFDKEHPKDDKELVKSIWTAIRHHNMKLILMGQSSEVGSNGWQWDEMKNCACLFVGSGIKTAIKHAKDLGISRATANQLEVQCDQIKNWLESKNQGLDAGTQYRVGLLVCGDQVAFVELPAAYKGTIQNEASSIVSHPWQSLEGESKPTLLESRVCPGCGGKLEKDGSKLRCKNTEHTRAMGKKTFTSDE